VILSIGNFDDNIMNKRKTLLAAALCILSLTLFAQVDTIRLKDRLEIPESLTTSFRNNKQLFP